MITVPRWLVQHGDCVELMAAMAPESVDAIVTDPPYGLGFMGKAWDGVPPGPEVAAAMFRVLKPGGHVVAFGGTRTYHRLACALEDAGLEIRDSLAWIYGSGFPKAKSVPRAIDHAAGVKGSTDYTPNMGNAVYGRALGGGDSTGRGYQAVTPEAQAWAGWATTLKPAMEPIVLARRPLAGSIAANVQAHGTGALNVDGCRVAANDPQLAAKYESVRGAGLRGNAVYGPDAAPRSEGRVEAHAGGRWPANVILTHGPGCEPAGTREVRTGVAVKRNGSDPQASREWMFGAIGRAQVGTPDHTFAGPDGRETIEAWDCEPDCPVRLLDEQSGESTTPATVSRGRSRTGHAYSIGNAEEPLRGIPSYGDTGGASRFFYTAKASRAEREIGLAHVSGVDRNPHPTVKPVALMAWLVRLVTPPGGLVLDPFTGSGTTGIAALREGFRFLGLEREAEYVEVARRRIAGDAPLFNAKENA